MAKKSKKAAKKGKGTVELKVEDLTLHKVGVVAMTKNHNIHILDPKREAVYNGILKRLSEEMNQAKIHIEQLLDDLVEVNVTYTVRPKT